VVREQGTGEVAAGPPEVHRIDHMRVRTGGEQHKP
jgi:hypothetical protein